MIPRLWVLVLVGQALFSYVAYAKVPEACGTYQGKVIDIHDPEHRGRASVMVPMLMNHEMWSMPSVPFGHVTLPSVGDSIWIVFEACDPTRPIWIGTPTVRCQGEECVGTGHH